MAAGLAAPGTVAAHKPQSGGTTSSLSSLIFYGSMTSQLLGTAMTPIAPWYNVGGGAQCANYGTPSQNGRYRGNLYFANVAGLPAAQYDDPVDPDPTLYPLESCNLDGPSSGNGGAVVVPKDEYYSLAVYVPTDPTIPNADGDTLIAEYHLTGIGHQPALQLRLHSDKVTARLNTGLYNSTQGSYQYNGRNTIEYAIPRGALVAGAWNEIAFHVRWATDSTGNEQFYYKTVGPSTWKAASAVSGIPSVSFDSTGSPGTHYTDNEGNYGKAFTQDFSTYETDVLEGTSLQAVEAAMP